MNSEPTAQQAACEYEAPVTRMTPQCPMCGGVLVPLRGQWRCSRCYFMLCAGCEPGLGHDGSGSGD
jgi:hypothetical protein